ncbi:uncharacterized protein Dmoj_GI25954, isoform D [Drosophila mojavensis]|uniref:Uncharacterized protein, isoform D n=1 Tax=Drosophila mojavensis TaxID=7230 RepID=A0A0Q9WXS7_DROMO|nr:uncharacterized protein Dmoj_GI25954, isoform D [Drosophila mojavensis]
MKLFFKIKSDPIFDIVAAQRQFNNVYAHMNMNTCQIVLLTLFMNPTNTIEQTPREPLPSPVEPKKVLLNTCYTFDKS